MDCETICSPRRWQFDCGKNCDGSEVRTYLVAGGGQAAGSQRAYSLGSCAMGQTDGETDGRIAVSLNAPKGGGIIIICLIVLLLQSDMNTSRDKYAENN